MKYFTIFLFVTFLAILLFYLTSVQVINHEKPVKCLVMKVSCSSRSINSINVLYNETRYSEGISPNTCMSVYPGKYINLYYNKYLHTVFSKDSISIELPVSFFIVFIIFTVFERYMAYIERKK